MFDPPWGIDARYPAPSKAWLAFLIAYPALIFTGYKLGLKTNVWFDLIPLFGGLPWVYGLFTFLTNWLYRGAYEAGVRDTMEIAIAQYFEMIEEKDPRAHDFRRKFDFHIEKVLGKRLINA